MYWILSNELADEDKDADITGSLNLDLGGAISFDNGIPVLSPLAKITLTMNDNARRGRMTDHLSITEATGLVFSSKLRDLLTILVVDNIQYFDFDIVDPKSGTVIQNYKIANVIGTVDCVDKEQSILKY